MQKNELLNEQCSFHDLTSTLQQMLWCGSQVFYRMFSYDKRHVPHFDKLTYHVILGHITMTFVSQSLNKP